MDSFGLETRNVRFGSKADMCSALGDVRYFSTSWEVVRRCGPPQSIDGLKSFLSDFGMFDSADFFALTDGVAGLDLDATRLHCLR